MSSLASKLLMCVCAGGTGAAIVPVSKAVRHQVAPRHATVKRVAAAPMAVAAAPCVPIVVGNALTPVGLDALSPMLALDSAPPMLTSAIGPQLETLGEVGDILAINGGIGSTSGGGGGGGGGGIGGGGGAPNGGLPPDASNAPEPTSWALMIGGFGLLGGAMRYSRRHTTA